MRFLKKHLEWIVFTTGLLMLAFMNPENAGTSLCLFEWVGFEFCLGEGLGHSISYAFKGKFTAALEAHIAGPFAILILSTRIGIIWQRLYKHTISTNYN
jgi:hypothetical protein